MMRKMLFASFALVAMFLSESFAVNPAKSPSPGSPLPAKDVVEHSYYQLSYSEENEQARWVFYTLSKSSIEGAASRTDDFREDPKIATKSATLDDYKGSGYDRGHLCPAADMRLNKTAMSESFFLSNMSPQVAGFNRGVWSRLEKQVRNWGVEKELVYVVTGPIFENNIGTIGSNKVTVPGYYYKVIYDGKDHMIGFVLPNASSSSALSDFVVTVDEIESRTGLDFFSELDDALEKRLESKIQLNGWNL